MSARSEVIRGSFPAKLFVQELGQDVQGGDVVLHTFPRNIQALESLAKDTCRVTVVIFLTTRY
jgi:hypothetical protein